MTQPVHLNTIADEISQNSIQFCASFPQWTNTKQYNRAERERIATLLECCISQVKGSSALLLDTPEYKQVRHCISWARTTWTGATYSIPDTKGARILSQSQLGTQEQKFQSAKAELTPLLDRLQTVYPGMVDSARATGGGRGLLFNEDDYPADIRPRFAIRWSIAPAARVPDYVRTHYPEIYERENERVRESLQGVIRKWSEDTASKMDRILDGLVSTLTSKINGKSKRFAPSAIETLREFGAHYRAMDFGGDADLSAQVSTLEGLLEGLTPEALANNAQLVRTSAESFAALQSDLQAQIIDKPSRRFRA